MIIILDTCVLYRDLAWKSTPFCLLEDFLSKSTSFLCIPGIVKDEISVKYKEKYIETHDKYAKAHRELEKLFLSGEVSTLNVEETFLADPEAYYRVFLESKLRNLYCIDFEYPATDHKTTVLRALKRMKPFDRTGRVGYRDYVLWQSVLELALQNPSETVVFISENTQDFCEKENTDSLAQELQRDMDAMNIDRNHILFYPALSKFVDVKLKPLLENYDSIANEDIIRGMENDNSSFYVQVNEATCNSLLGKNIDGINIEIDAFCINIIICSIYDDIDSISIDEVSIIDQDRLLITGTSGFVSDIEFDVLKKDVLGLKKIYFTVDVNNIDPRSEYVHAYSQIWIRFDFDAVYDTKNGTLISIDFNDLRNGNDDCWMCGGCDDDEDYDDTSDEQIKDIIKDLDVDPNQMSLF